MKTYPGVLARASGLLVALLLAAPWAQACGPYDIAFYELGSLYYQNASKQYVGIDKDLIEEIGRRSGCPFHHLFPDTQPSADGTGKGRTH